MTIPGFEGPVTPQLLESLKKGGDIHALGYTPSGVRPTDYLAPPADVPRAAPPTFFHPGYRKVPVRSQQGGTCVSNSLSTCLTLLEYVEQQGEIVNFDAEAWSGRIVAKDYGEGAASSPHDLLDDAMKHGVPAVSGSVQGLYFPKGYAWLDFTNPQAIQAAMSTPGQVVTGAIWLLSNFGSGGTNSALGDGTSNQGGKEYIKDIPGENPWGLHEITYAGYDSQGVIYQNSWGTWWGDGGFGRLSWDYIAKRSTELIAVTDNPDNAGGYVKTYDWGAATETAIAHEDLPNRKRPAVYLVKNNGRIWITDPTQAKRFGVKLPPVRVPDTDSRWGLPVIGPDAPKNLR